MVGGAAKIAGEITGLVKSCSLVVGLAAGGVWAKAAALARIAISKRRFFIGN